MHYLKMTTALQPISGNILSPFVDQENVPSQKQKKIKKRRKSVGPPPGVDPLPALQLPMARRRRLVDAALERPGAAVARLAQLVQSEIVLSTATDGGERCGERLGPVVA